MKKNMLWVLLTPAVLAACTPDEAEDPHEVEGSGAAAEPVVPLEPQAGARENEAQGADPQADDLGAEATGDVTPENTPADEGL